MTAITDLLTQIAGDFLLAFITLGLMALAYWRKDMVLYVVAGVALVLFGLYFTATNMGIGILIAALGAYTALYKGALARWTG